ncbi:MAG TPA: hypothetical protein VGE67_01495, partial [Haloferula sp.]
LVDYPRLARNLRIRVRDKIWQSGLTFERAKRKRRQMTNFRFSRVPPNIEDQRLSKMFKNLLSIFEKNHKAREATGAPIFNKA